MFQNNDQQKAIEKRMQQKDTGMMVGNAITNAVNYIIAKGLPLDEKKIVEIAKKICNASIELKDFYTPTEEIPNDYRSV